jgi:hypothetical protein
LARLRQQKEKQIFLADGDEDYSRECALSGEPRIQTMDPALYSHELHDPATNKGIDIIERQYLLLFRAVWYLNMSGFSNERVAALAVAQGETRPPQRVLGSLAVDCIKDYDWSAG